LLSRGSSPHSSLKFDGSEPVLVLIVSVRCLERQRAVAVALPSAAKIDRVVDPADVVVTADAQGYGVVLAVADVGKSDAAQNRGVECARRSETVDAKRIVSAVLAGPFAVIDQAGRNFVEGKIDHRVRADDHCVRPSFKFCNEPAKDIVVDVEVVGIKLDGVLTAVAGVNRLVPASADTKVAAFGQDMLDPRIADAAQDFSRAIGGMVVDDDYIEIEISALGEDAFDCFEDCPIAI